MTDAKPHILGGMGVQSTLQLSEKQLDDVIKRVEDLVNRKQTDADRHTREWRHKCLRMVQACGIDTRDWNNVNAFLLDKRIAGKHLYEMDIQELIVLHKKLHNVRDNFAKKDLEEKRLTTLN
jgi:hypothetical protein